MKNFSCSPLINRKHVCLAVQMVTLQKVKMFLFLIGKITFFGIIINVQIAMRLALLVKVKEHSLMVFKILVFQETTKIVHLVLRYLISLLKKN
jgi:hypothetical protein